MRKVVGGLELVLFIIVEPFFASNPTDFDSSLSLINLIENVAFLVLETDEITPFPIRHRY